MALEHDLVSQFFCGNYPIGIPGILGRKNCSKDVFKLDPMGLSFLALRKGQGYKIELRIESQILTVFQSDCTTASHHLPDSPFSVAGVPCPVGGDAGDNQAA